MRRQDDYEQKIASVQEAADKIRASSGLLTAFGPRTLPSIVRLLEASRSCLHAAADA